MNIILILGNGFDLNLGLPTSFSHFINSVYFRNLLTTNDLCTHMESTSTNNLGWVDIEYELANYSMAHSKSSTLKSDYLELKQALADYIGEVDSNYNEIDKDSQAYLSFGDNFFRSVNHYSSDNLTVINFNYTHSIKKIKRSLYGDGLFSTFLELAECLLPLMGEDHVFSKINYVYPHGAVDTGIVFGVDDSSLISPKHTFLRKSCDPAFSPFDNEVLLYADKVIIWGHSLGESDHAYFIDFFTAQASGKYPRKEIIITYYGEMGYDSIISQLDVLTNHNIRGLKVNNKLKLIDSSSDECRWKL